MKFGISLVITQLLQDMPSEFPAVWFDGNDRRAPQASRPFADDSVVACFHDASIVPRSGQIVIRLEVEKDASGVGGVR